jgi:hypothetical protein
VDLTFESDDGDTTAEATDSILAGLENSLSSAPRPSSLQQQRDVNTRAALQETWLNDVAGPTNESTHHSRSTAKAESRRTKTWSCSTFQLYNYPSGKRKRDTLSVARTEIGRKRPRTHGASFNFSSLSSDFEANEHGLLFLAAGQSGDESKLEEYEKKLLDQLQPHVNLSIQLCGSNLGSYDENSLKRRVRITTQGWLTVLTASRL